MPRACPRTPSRRWPRHAAGSRSCLRAQGTGARASLTAWLTCAAWREGGPRGQTRGARRAAAAPSRHLAALQACSCAEERRRLRHLRRVPPAFGTVHRGLRPRHAREGLTRGRASVRKPCALALAQPPLGAGQHCASRGSPERHGGQGGGPGPRRRIPSAPAAVGRACCLWRRIVHGRPCVEYPGASRLEAYARCTPQPASLTRHTRPATSGACVRRRGDAV